MRVEEEAGGLDLYSALHLNPKVNSFVKQTYKLSVLTGYLVHREGDMMWVFRGGWGE